MEDVLVKIAELRGDAEQACGIHRGFDVRLEALDTAAEEIDVAIHYVVRDRVHRDVHVVEDAQVRQARISGAHRPFAVGHPGPQDIQFLQDGGPDGDFLGIGYRQVADGVLPERLRVFRVAVAGIVPDGHRQGGGPVVRKGVGLAEVETLVEAVVAAVAEEFGGTDGFGLEGGFGQELAFLDGGPAEIRLEFPAELLLFRQFILD